MRPRILCFWPLLALSTPLHAVTLLVDSTSDDGSAAFQICDSDSANANCSLRGAIDLAHANGGPDTITFAIPDTDPGYLAATAHWRFTPASEYPFVTDDLIIDGYSQPGALENTQTPEQGGSNATLKIELRGPGVSAQSAGLHAVNGDARLTVRGVAINSFRANLQFWTPGPHHVEGCFIGTDISGMLAADTSNGNGIGIRLNGQLIAGDGTPASRNVISGNPYIGIWDDRNAAHSIIQGNLIGTNATGTAALPGQDFGIYAVSVGNGALVGGSDPSQRNLISGNTFGALNISPQISGANPQPYRVVGNFIGTDISGTLPIGNGINPQSPSQPLPSITVFGLGACGLEIGGDAAGEGNLIGYGGQVGILVSVCDRAPIVGNRFVLNRGIAIDLSTSNADIGPTPNDPGDGDANPPAGGGSFVSGNRLQNSPEILGLVRSGDSMTLTYRVDTDVANASYPLRIDIARGRAGQAEFPIAIDSYGAIDAGLPKSITFPASALEGGALVLSATDAAGNTSEFGGEHLFADTFE